MEHVSLHPIQSPTTLEDCGGAAPYQMFTWAAGPAADVSALWYADDGHGSGRVCLGACGVAPECRFVYDYAYAGLGFATLPHSATSSCCAACKADSRWAIFVLNGTSCAMNAAMTSGNAIRGVVLGNPNR